MTLDKWLRTKIYRSVDHEKVRRVNELSDEVSDEARRLRRRAAEPESADLLRAAIRPARNGNGRA